MSWLFPGSLAGSKAGLPLVITLFTTLLLCSEMFFRKNKSKDKKKKVTWKAVCVLCVLQRNNRYAMPRSDHGKKKIMVQKRQHNQMPSRNCRLISNVQKTLLLPNGELDILIPRYIRCMILNSMRICNHLCPCAIFF